ARSAGRPAAVGGPAPGVAGGCSSALPLGDLVGESGDDLEQVPHHPEVGDGEDRRVGVLVHRDDRLGGLHPGPVLDGPGDADGHVQLGRDRLAGLPDLVLVGVPAGVDGGPAGPHPPPAAGTAAGRAPPAAPRESASASTRAKLDGSWRPRPPETTISASATSGRPPCSWTRWSITRTGWVAPAPRHRGFSSGSAGVSAAGNELGLTASTGVPVRTRARTVVAPPNTLW